MIYSAEFPDGFRKAVDLRGFQMGTGRQPLSTDQQTDLMSLQRTLQCMLAENGYTDEPVGGCKISDSEAVDIQEITSIVHNIVSELNRRGMI